MYCIYEVSKSSLLNCHSRIIFLNYLILSTGSPQNVSVRATTHTTIDISWKPPIADSQDGIVLKYSISCSSHGWKDSSTLSWHYNHYQWNHLVPFTHYTCCVKALTTNGPSNPTCNTNQTLEDSKYNNLSLSDSYCHIFIIYAVPLDPPQTVSLLNVSAYALLLEWSNPDTPNGIITVYNIYVTYDNGSMEKMTVDGSENSCLIGGLSLHHLVYVRISASTIAGEGPSSSRLQQRTDQASKILMRPFISSF